MERSIQLIILFFILLFYSACKKQDDTPVIFVTPNDLQIQMNAGDLIEFEVHAFSGSSPLSGIKIRQKPVGGITTTLLDTLIQGEQASFFFVYNIPTGTADIVLTFEVIDNLGNNGETARRILVEGNQFMLESSGHVLYSKFSNSGNAFSLENLQPYFLGIENDSTLLDLVEFDSNDDGNLSLSWQSYSGLKFVKNNSFNYPEATVFSTQSSYLSSTPVSIVSDLAVDDILIVRTDSIFLNFSVIKITGIQEDVGSENDRYVFNVKK